MRKMNLAGLTLALALLPAVGHAGLTDREKALWGASANAPTTFALPAGGDVVVMTKAASLLGDWVTRDRYMYAMPIRTQTATLIQTEDPTQLNEVGFKVQDTRTANGSVITVDVSSFEGKVLQVSQQRRDANKRAHLLAYLLEQYAGVATTPSLTPLPMPVAALPIPTPQPVNSASAAFDPALQQLRSQLSAGRYDAAIKTLDGLRAAIVGQSKPAH